MQTETFIRLSKKKNGGETEVRSCGQEFITTHDKLKRKNTRKPVRHWLRGQALNFMSRNNAAKVSGTLQQTKEPKQRMNKTKCKRDGMQLLARQWQVRKTAAIAASAN